MLTRKYRPVKLSEFCGQDFVKDTIKAVVKSPEMAPSVYLFYGEHGLGKTTAARILARALNCEGSTKVKPCGVCPICTESLDHTPYYQEHDCATAGTKDDILQLKDLMYLSLIPGTLRVIVLDEFHLCSRAAQGSLLKVLEELPEDIYIVLCTTNPEAVLTTVRSRSIEVPFKTVSDKDMAHHLVSIINREAIDITPASVRLIMISARGHVRTALSLLTLFRILGESEQFDRSLLGCRTAAYHYLDSFVGDISVKKLESVIQSLSQFPAAQLQSELDLLVTELVKCYCMDAHRVPGKASNEMIETSCYESQVLILQEVGETDPSGSSRQMGSVSSLPPQIQSADEVQESGSAILPKLPSLTTTPHDEGEQTPVFGSHQTPTADSSVSPDRQPTGSSSCIEGSLVGANGPVMGNSSKVSKVILPMVTTIKNVTNKKTNTNTKENRESVSLIDSSLIPEQQSTHQTLPEPSSPGVKGPQAPDGAGTDLSQQCRPVSCTRSLGLSALSKKLDKGVLPLVSLLTQEWVREGLSNQGSKEAVLWAVRARFARSSSEEGTATTRSTGRRLKGAQ